MSALVTILFATSAFAQVTRQWVARYDENSFVAGAAQQVLVDGHADVYIVGNYPSGNLLVAKYDPAGVKLWDRQFADKGAGVPWWYGPMHTGVVDPSNRLVLVGPAGYVMMLDPEGNTLWEKSAAADLGGPADFAVAAIDSSGNIYAAGTVGDAVAGHDALVVKYAPDGQMLWSRTYDGSSGEDNVSFLRVGTAGNVVAGGTSSNGILLLGYDASGNTAFLVTDSTRTMGGVTDIDIDGLGNVVATGSVRNGEYSNGHFYVAKFDGSGSRVWLSTEETLYGSIWAVRADREGSIYAAGTASPGGLSSYLLRKYSSQGALLWTRDYYEYGDSGIFAMELDQGLEPVITGEVGYCYDSIRTMKFSSDGALRWSDGYYSGYYKCGSVNFGLSLALDSKRNVYIAGYTSTGDYVLPKPTLIKYVQTALAVTVPIDIKPGQTPNSINLGSGGTVAVAILSTADFDATRVDPLTVTLANASVALRGNGTSMASLQDVNGDGRLDIIIHVSTDALQLSDGDTQAVLEGRTLDGIPFQGGDSVRIVP